ncbi:MAG: hypothetical protein IJN24_04935 [Bacteroidaceae bacterium]|nr:hypothetical protein [Bacteroidaceae bacterium]MBR7166721.1 hypothetical protein [Bacteroidaceae bacterium]
MRRVKGRDANMKFLYGSVFFFFVILMTIGLFVYFTLQKHWYRPDAVSNGYEITFSRQFAGLDYDLYLNDSLIYEGCPVNVDTVLRVQPFVDDNALLVVERSSDKVTILEIGRRGKVLVCFGRDGNITADVKE